MVSIIVPNYNHARFLPERLNSIFNQTFQDYEVILLDDASTDNSVEILNQYAANPKVSHFIVNQENSGSPFKQWKRGIDLARGEFVWIAESDDYSNTRFLELMIKNIESSCEVGICFSRSVVVGENDEYIRLSNDHNDHWNDDKELNGIDLIQSSFRYGSPIWNVSSSLIRNQSIADANCEWFTYTYSGDWHLYLDILQNYKLKYISTPLNYFRMYSDSHTWNNSVANAERDKIRELIKNINYAQKILKTNTMGLIGEYLWMCDQYLNRCGIERFKTFYILKSNFPLEIKISFIKRQTRIFWKRVMDVLHNNFIK